MSTPPAIPGTTTTTPAKRGYRPGSWIALPITIVLTLIAFLIYAVATRPDTVSQAEVEANRAKTSAPGH